MWESVVSISKVLGKDIGGFFPVVFSMNRHFLRSLLQLSVLCGEPEPLEQLAFGLLHTTCRVGVAEGGCDALEGVDAESLS